MEGHGDRGRRERIKFLKTKMEGNFSNRAEERERGELSRGGGNFRWEGSLLSRRDGGVLQSAAGVGWRDLRWVLSRLGGLFSVRQGRWGGVPSAGGAAGGMMLQATAEVPLPAGRRSKWQWGYQSHEEGGRKMNCWVRREPTGSSGSLVEPLVQMV